MKKHIIYIALLACPLLPACQKVGDADRVALAGSEEVEKTSESLVLFHAASEGDASAETSTKATVVTSLASFQASATRGSAGSETSKWNNVTFTSDGAGTPTFSGGKYWPNSDEYYHFYAANSAITFAASGSTITTTNNATDVVYAYMSSPTYKTRNTLTFKHAYARLKEVSVSAASGYTISNIDIKITPKTHGTFNMRTETWSSTVNGSTTSVANSSPGTKTNDIYLLPGSYTMTASWRAVRGDYAENFSDISASAPITIERGKMNSVDITLGGNATDLKFTISVTAWGNNSIALGEIPTQDPPPTFGGLQIAPAPLYYNGTSFEIKDNDWNHDSYNSVYGLNNGSYYFNFLQLGQYFDADGGSFSTSSGDIDNTNKISYGGHNDWRLLTWAEWCTITTGESPGTSREGGAVNGNSGSKYAIIQLTGVTHAGSGTPVGLLLFPDGVTITGKALSGINNTTCTTGVTGSELDAYLGQGCVFLPGSGRYNSSWGNGGSYGYWRSATRRNNSLSYYLNFSSEHVNPSGTGSSSNNYFPVRLVR